MNEEEINLEEESSAPVQSNIAFGASSGDVGFVEPEVIQEEGGEYAAPFQSKIGFSSVDLTDKVNQDRMLEEYDTWFKHGLSWGVVAEDKKEERSRLRDNWYQKYHGMGYDDYKELKSQQPKKTMYGFDMTVEGIDDYTKTVKQRLSAPGKGAFDFLMDAVGNLGEWGDAIDDRWDAATKFDDEFAQQVSEVSSVVIPSLITGWGTTKVLGNLGVQNMPALARLITNAGAWVLEGNLVAQISDTSEEHSLSGSMVKLWPETFGQGGRLPLSEQFVTYDEDSPSIRKEKNKKEATILAVVSVIAGGALSLLRSKKLNQVKPEKLEWFIPKSDEAAQYKQLNLFKGADEDTLKRIDQLQEVLQTKSLSKQNEEVLINELLALEEEVKRIGSLDEVAERANRAIDEETLAAKNRKIDNPDQLELDLGIDPDFDDINLLDPASKTRQIPPEGNVARNMADTTAIKLGNSTGDPAPVITESMREKGMLIGDSSRDVVMGIAESSRRIGDFDAIVDGFRYDNEQMNLAGWAIFRDIISADNLDDVKNLFLNDRDVKNLLLGRFKVETVNEDQARGIAFAIKYLTDRFLGEDIATASARVMDTLGREIGTLAETIQDFAPDWIDDDRVIGTILDKLVYLMSEYSLNKYVSGWSLRNKNWFNEIPPGEMNEVLEGLTDDFIKAQDSIWKKNQQFGNTLKALKKNKPEAVKPLIDVFRLTDGDVVDLAGLYKWTEDQVTPWGAIKSPNPKELNYFAKGLWQNHMNFVLSGQAPLGATIGNLYMIMAQPITSMLRAIPISMRAGDVDAIRRVMYYHGAVFETNRRALTHAWKVVKKAWKDPNSQARQYRKDFIIKEDRVGETIRSMRDVVEKDGNVGLTLQIDAAEMSHKIGRIPLARWGSTALMFPDAYVQDIAGTYASRVRAYDEVLYEFGAIPYGDGMKLVKEAELRHAKNKWDINGRLKDPLAQSMAGEIQLNLDDGLSRWINQAITAYPISRYLLMFPRTMNNWVRLNASWSPLTTIPGMSKVSKTIYAETEAQKIEALLEHGIDMRNVPNAGAIFDSLKRNYEGRLMYSGMLFTSLFSYAMAGNIRGNLHYNKDERMKQKTQMNMQEHTVKVGDKWVYYGDIPGVNIILDLIGDTAMYLKDFDQPFFDDIAGKIMWTLTGSLLGDSPLFSIEPLLAILNSDFSGFQRLSANISRTFIPMSGAMGILSNAIDGVQKDIQGEYLQYLANRFPGTKSMLPDFINPLGGPNNGRFGYDWTNPWGVLNQAMNPFAVTRQHGGDDLKYTVKSGRTVTFNEVLERMNQFGYRGMSRLTKDSTGSYEYKPAEKEQILDFMAKQQLWTQFAEVLFDPFTEQQHEDMMKYSRENRVNPNEDIELKFQLMPWVKELDRILKNGQIEAEKEYNFGDQTIIDQAAADQEMKRGDVDAASKVEKENLETQKLLQYNNN